MNRWSRFIALLLATLLLASPVMGVLPQQLKSARMTDATLARDIDDQVGNIEKALADILGLPVDTDINGAIVPTVIAERFSGADAGAKIQAAINDSTCLAGGCIVDARGFDGSQTIATTVSVTKPVTILLGRVEFSGAADPKFNVTTSKVTISGIGPATKDANANSSVIVMATDTVGITAQGTGVGTEVHNVRIENVHFRGPNNATGTGVKFRFTRASAVLYSGFHDLKTGIQVDGSIRDRFEGNVLRNFTNGIFQSDNTIRNADPHILRNFFENDGVSAIAGDSISLSRQDGGIIAKNTFFGNALNNLGRSHIRILSPSIGPAAWFIICSNDIFEPNEDGIYIENAPKSIICANNIAWPRRNAIRVINTTVDAMDVVVISLNQIELANARGKSAIFISSTNASPGSLRTSLTGNTLTNNGNEALLTGDYGVELNNVGLTNAEANYVLSPATEKWDNAFGVLGTSSNVHIVGGSIVGIQPANIAGTASNVFITGAFTDTGGAGPKTISSTFPIHTFRRDGSTTSTVLNTFRVLGVSSGDMVDGFGSAFRMAIQDNAAGPNDVVEVAAMRNGADNTGQLVITTATLGTFTQRLKVDGDTTAGNTALLLSWSGGLPARVSVGAVDSCGTGFRCLKVAN